MSPLSCLCFVLIGYFVRKVKKALDLLRSICKRKFWGIGFMLTELAFLSFEKFLIQKYHLFYL
jgi:hypothetical protein